MTRISLAALAALASWGVAAGSASAYQAVESWPKTSFSKSDSSDGASSTRRARVSRTAVEDDDRPVRRGRGVSRQAAMPSLTGGSGYQSGIASYYWQPQRLASGGMFNPNAMTAAHRSLPFGTKVRVTNLNNGRSTVVTINDRGPYVGGRVIDLSSAAAGAVGMKGAGLARVKLDVVGR